MRSAFALVICLCCVLLGKELRGQELQGSLSGAVADSSGRAIAGATISVKSLATGQGTEARSDSSGRYAVSGLAAGAYTVAIAAPGFQASTTTVTLAAGERKTVDIALEPELSLGDLGFTASQTQGSVQDQARLDRRTHMLKMHQRLGLITAASFVGTLISSTNAGGRATSTSGRNIHVGFGVLTTGLYLTTASFAILAPKIPGTETKGPIRVHKALAWIHGAGMILTPVLGGIAYHQRSLGERVHGIASAHGMVAAITAGAYGAAILSLSIRF